MSDFEDMSELAYMVEELKIMYGIREGFISKCEMCGVLNAKLCEHNLCKCMTCARWGFYAK